MCLFLMPKSIWWIKKKTFLLLWHAIDNSIITASLVNKLSMFKGLVSLWGEWWHFWSFVLNIITINDHDGMLNTWIFNMSALWLKSFIFTNYICVQMIKLSKNFDKFLLFWQVSVIEKKNCCFNNFYVTQRFLSLKLNAYVHRPI